MKKLFTLLTLLMSSVLSQGQFVKPTQEYLIKSDTAVSDSFDLLEVCVTATRSNQNDPISQNMIPMGTLKKIYQGQDIPVLLNFSNPSITFYSDGGNYVGYMYYRLRGVDQTKINATLNGAPLNEPEDQGAYFSNYQDFFSNVSSIQIQKGVGTSSNGTSSFIGSMNFQSPNLSDSAYTKMEIGEGSFNTSRYSVTSNTGLKNGIGTYIRYSRISSDGYRNNSGTLGNTIFASTGYQTDKMSIKYVMFYGNSRNQMAWMPSNESDIAINRKNNPLVKDENDNFTQSMNILSFNSKISKKLSFNSTFFYNNLMGNYDVNINDGVDSTSDPIFNYKLKSDFSGSLFSLNYISVKLNISTGLSQNTYNRQHFMGMKPHDNSQYIHNNLGEKLQLSTFFKINYRLNSKISAYSDVQYRSVTFNYYPEFYDRRSYIPYKWGFLNPKIGVNYKNKKSRVYTYFGLSHREPTRADIFNQYLNYMPDKNERDSYDPDNLTPLVMSTYNPKIQDSGGGIKREKVYDYEIGYDYNTLNHHKFSINGFYMYFMDGLLPVGELNVLGLPINDNVDKSYRSGVELDYTYDIKSFNLYFGGTLMTSKILSGEYSNKQMLLTPNLVLNSNIQYTIRDFNFTILNKYVSRSYLNNLNTTDYLKSYLVSNLNLSFTPHKNENLPSELRNNLYRFKVGVNINNIFNINYYNSGQVSNGSRQYFVAAPRNYFINITYTF